MIEMKNLHDMPNIFRDDDDDRSEVHSKILRDTRNAVNLIRRNNEKKQRSSEYIVLYERHAKEIKKSLRQEPSGDIEPAKNGTLSEC